MGRPYLALIAATSILAACSGTTVVIRDNPDTEDDIKVEREDRKNEKKGPSTAATLGIPPGHLPPPGSCRVWIPGDPPGHQAPSGSCSKLASQVPPSGWLIYRPSKSKKEVKVSVYDQHKPGVIVVIRFYDSKSGDLLREENPPTDR
jgi:hypothetical protein